MRLLKRPALLCLYTLIPALVAAQGTPPAHLASRPLDANQSALFAQSMELFDASYDDHAHLLRRPQDGGTHVHGVYMVRESSWYALALLRRQRPGDRERANTILDTVLHAQYTDPARKWYGTFRRSLEDPDPAVGNAAFSTYDPNWRHFIGTIFELILIEYPAQLQPGLAARMLHSIHLAVDGELHDGRLLPSYSNIALMYGALWDFAAAREHNAAWQRGAAAWTAEVYRLFQAHSTFSEFNAPTYYGVDLYGLGLWREYGSDAHLREMGSTMEASLWRSIAQFYQPALRNLAGPYDRAYGMDMTQYVTPTGVWMRTVLDAGHAPLPVHPTLKTYQVADLWFTPQIVLLGTHIPADALGQLRAAPAPAHPVRVVIDSQRTATAWLGTSSMWGGEATGETKDSGGRTQFHPATAHWAMPTGQIGWLAVTHSPEIDASADAQGIALKTHGDVTLRVFTGTPSPALTAKRWTLPGATISITTDGQNFSTAQPADCEGCVDVTYKEVQTMELRIQP